jgi:hypothetical protein
VRRLTAVLAAAGAVSACAGPSHDPPRHIVATESRIGDFHASMAALDQVRERAGRSGTRPRAVAVSGDTWAALARCESSMRNDGHGPYYGYFQFSAATWHSLGYDGLPDEVDYVVQRAAAERLVARSGWGQFPRCARRLGLR